MSPALLPKHVASVVKYQRDPIKALAMFNSVKTENGFKHTLLTYKCMIEKLGFHGEFEEMESLMSEVRMNIDNSLLEGVYIGAIRNYGRKGKVQEAVDVFERMDFYNCEPSVQSYNAVMNILVEYGYFNQAHKVYLRMRDKVVIPDVYTFTIRIKSFCRTRRPHVALRLLNNMPSQGCELNAVAYCTVIGGFYEENCQVEAYQLFEGMLEQCICPDITTFNKLIHTLCKKGDVQESEKLLNKVLKRGILPNLFTFNIFIQGLCKKGALSEAVRSLDGVRCEGLKPTIVLYNTLVKGLSQRGLILQALQLINEMLDHGCSPNIWTYNLVINGLCKMGCMSDANILTNDAIAKGYLPDIFTFNTLIDGYSTYNIMINSFVEKLNINMAEKLFREMGDKGCAPDSYTYRIIIDGFCKTGNIDSGYDFLIENIEKGFIPSLTTFGQVLNCLCVGHRVLEAVGIIHLMVRKGIVPEVVNTIFEADKKEVAAPKIVVEDLLKKSHITYYAYEVLYDGIRDRKLHKKKLPTRCSHDRGTRSLNVDGTV
ncbi:putative pentatricopeptide repeat-containing protein [Quercus suber]|uniref:Pentatricopeptide repeat-containing protein n=1 Tax=Quercus suber TaxID=58331 RepID=A0AAW0LZ94_QUESU